VHEVIWTDALLDEWEEVIVGDHRRSAESAAAVTASIRAFFPESKVEREPAGGQRLPAGTRSASVQHGGRPPTRGPQRASPVPLRQWPHAARVPAATGPRGGMAVGVGPDRPEDNAMRSAVAHGRP
jgi:hypothetical protein